MKTSRNWVDHFENNLCKQRIDWRQAPTITQNEIRTILRSLQAWQLGETSDGSHLLRASALYAKRIKDPSYTDAVRLFIREEQKHGNNLGNYLDLINKDRIRKDWGDTLFRKIRYFNTSMEIWTLTVITVESAAQVYYQCLKDATSCNLLKQICTDILIDEAYHIDFQMERLAILFNNKSGIAKFFVEKIYSIFYFITIFIIWGAHKSVFAAGGLNFRKYFCKMRYKYFKTLHKITYKRTMAVQLQM